MASKLIVIRQRLAGALGAAFAAFTGELSPVLDERIGPFLDDEDAGFDFDALQRALARMVEASRDRLVEADKAHLDELAGDVAGRDERDRRVRAVRDKLIEIRGTLTALFGAQRTRQIVAVDGPTAEQPELLWRQGEHTVERLRDPGLRLSAGTGAVNLDPSRWADELEPEVEGLRRAIDAVGVDVREAALTVEVKKEAMAEHDRLMSACGRILSGLCLLADRPDLARQVRVTPPRSKAGPHPDPLPQGERAPSPAPSAEQQEAGETPALPADAGETTALPEEPVETPVVSSGSSAQCVEEDPRGPITSPGNTVPRGAQSLTPGCEVLPLPPLRPAGTKASSPGFQPRAPRPGGPSSSRQGRGRLSPMATQVQHRLTVEEYLDQER